jgi:hypothetical protein
MKVPFTIDNVSDEVHVRVGDCFFRDCIEQRLEEVGTAVDIANGFGVVG